MKEGGNEWREGGKKKGKLGKMCLIGMTLQRANIASYMRNS